MSTRLTVNVFHNHRDGTVHITSAEPDRVNFHTYLPKNSAATEKIIAMLRREATDGPQREDLHLS
jgi:hypothetical protein